MGRLRRRRESGQEKPSHPCHPCRHSDHGLGLDSRTTLSRSEYKGGRADPSCDLAPLAGAAVLRRSRSEGPIQRPGYKAGRDKWQSGEAPARTSAPFVVSDPPGRRLSRRGAGDRGSGRGRTAAGVSPPGHRQEGRHERRPPRPAGRLPKSHHRGARRFACRRPGRCRHLRTRRGY